MNSNFATPEATASRRKSFEDEGLKDNAAAEGHFRESNGYSLSSIGIGTYLGNWDAATDENYKASILRYVERGGNVIDTAANYRFQRSEKSIGKALDSLPEGVSRSELFISTKAGFLPFENEPPTDVRGYFEDTFVKTGIARFEDLVGGSHCMSPGYLQSQIDQSLSNMGLAGLDLFYIHNPESQLAEIDRYTFEARIAEAFELLEQNRADSKINFYGIASWNGFRIKPDEKNYHSLERFVSIAKQVGGDNNGFKFIQLPHNLAMPEAYLLPNQAASGKALPVLRAAENLGITAVASASLLQGKLAMNVPIHIRETFGGLTTDAMTSLQFCRSTPGITTALVGMSTPAHVDENMKLASVKPESGSTYVSLFSQTTNAR